MNFDELNFDVAGNTSDNYVEPDPYTVSSGTFMDSMGNIVNSAGKILSGGSGTGAQLAGMAGIAALLNSLGGSGSGGFAGYRGGIPKYTATRTMNPIPTTTTNAAGQTVPRRPGSGGISYFSPMVYTPQAPVAAAPAEAVAPVATPAVVEPEKYAGGGIANLGGYSDGGQLLRGPGDGVSDDIPATIGNKQPARLADGEFVVPARIVSELGNGSTEAGARKLYAMMDRIKNARKKSMKNIAANSKADKHLPA